MAREKWVEMWGDAAASFGQYDNVVGYELMVEPDAPDPAAWNALAGEIIGRIRLSDKVAPVFSEQDVSHDHSRPPTFV